MKFRCTIIGSVRGNQRVWVCASGIARFSWSDLRKGLACETLRDLVPYVQFEKREKHPWRKLTFSKLTE